MSLPFNLSQIAKLAFEKSFKLHKMIISVLPQMLLFIKKLTYLDKTAMHLPQNSFAHVTKLECLQA